MKTITSTWQPFASLIAAGKKTIRNADKVSPRRSEAHRGAHRHSRGEEKRPGDLR